MNMFEKAFKKTDKGQFTEKNFWYGKSTILQSGKIRLI